MKACTCARIHSFLAFIPLSATTETCNEIKRMLTRSATTRVVNRALNRRVIDTASCQTSLVWSNRAFTAHRMMSTVKAPTSFSHEKMEADARYKATLDIPESLMQTPPEESPFSIQGKFREGRAAYLDMSATTPLDPRVLDAMAPYMVSQQFRVIERY